MSDGVNNEQLLRIYAQSKTIAVVGASADESKAAQISPRDRTSSYKDRRKSALVTVRDRF